MSLRSYLIFQKRNLRSDRFSILFRWKIEITRTDNNSQFRTQLSLRVVCEAWTNCIEKISTNNTNCFQNSSRYYFDKKSKSLELTTTFNLAPNRHFEWFVKHEQIVSRSLQLITQIVFKIVLDTISIKNRNHSNWQQLTI